VTPKTGCASCNRFYLAKYKSLEMAKRKITTRINIGPQISLFDERQLDAMLHTKVVECKLLKELATGDQFSLKDTSRVMRITELETISGRDTYILDGDMQGRPVVVSVTTKKTYLVNSATWEWEVIIVRNKSKNILVS